MQGMISIEDNSKAAVGLLGKLLKAYRNRRKGPSDE